MRSALRLPFMILSLTAAACGQQNKPEIAYSPGAGEQKLIADNDVITDAAFEAVIAEEEFSDRSKAPECLALRGEINVLRTALLAKAEWLSMVKTQTWQTLKDNYDAYTHAKCPAITLPATEISESCSTLRGTVIEAWSAVEGSPEYQVVDQHDALKSLVDKWNRAQAANCIAS